MFKLQAVPTGFQMYLPSMATLATCTTSSAGTRVTVYSVTPAQLPQIPLCPTEERILALMGRIWWGSSSGHQPAVYMVGVLGFHVSQERLRECTDLI